MRSPAAAAAGRSLLIPLLGLLICAAADPAAQGADITVDELSRAARAFGGDSRMLFGFPTGSSLSLTASLLTPLLYGSPVAALLNVTWVPIVIPIDRPQQQLEYLDGQRSRSDDLHDIYSHLETAVEQFGYPGRPCVQRFLCEAAGRRGDSEFLTRVLQLMLEVPPADNDDVIGRDLHEAKWRGVEDAGGCEAAYPVCPASVFEMLDSANLL